MFRLSLSFQLADLLSLLITFGLDFDKNLANIFDKVVCLAYSRSGSVIEKIYSQPCPGLHKFSVNIQVSFLQWWQIGRYPILRLVLAVNLGRIWKQGNTSYCIWVNLVSNGNYFVLLLKSALCISLSTFFQSAPSFWVMLKNTTYLAW